MCCIIVKPKGVKTPFLDKIFDMNPDGFGFVTTDGDYYRALSCHDALKRAYAIPYDETAIIHARLATHGSIKVGNCHPFNMGDVFFAHNGVLGIPSVNDMTDSEICFRNIIYPAIKAMGVARAADIINEQCGASRFAIMRGGTVYLFGRWYYMNGCYYSNMRFMPYTRFEPIKAGYIAV